MPLAKRPQRKTKCKACGAFIFSKRRPQDRLIVLVTEAGAAEIERQWLALQTSQDQARRHDLETAAAGAKRDRAWNRYLWALLKLGQIHAGQSDFGAAADLIGQAMYLMLAGALDEPEEEQARQLGVTLPVVEPGPGFYAELGMVYDALGLDEEQARQAFEAAAEKAKRYAGRTLDVQAAWRGLLPELLLGAHSGDGEHSDR